MINDENGKKETKKPLIVEGKCHYSNHKCKNDNKNRTNENATKSVQTVSSIFGSNKIDSNYKLCLQQSEQSAKAQETKNVEKDTISSPSCSRYSNIQYQERSSMNTTVANNPSIRSVRSFCCRICHSGDESESLISPCLCRGTVAYVHKACLEQWLNTSGTIHCELCKYQFPTKMCLRYGFWHSLVLWYRHPNNMETFKADFIICLLLSVVTFGIITITIIGLLMLQTNSQLHYSRSSTQGPLILFLTIVVFVYFINLFLMLKSQFVPWYRWWHSARQVKLIYTTVKEQKQSRRHQWLKRKRHQPSDVEREIRTVDI